MLLPALRFIFPLPLHNIPVLPKTPGISAEQEVLKRPGFRYLLRRPELRFLLRRPDFRFVLALPAFADLAPAYLLPLANGTANGTAAAAAGFGAAVAGDGGIVRRRDGARGRARGCGGGRGIGTWRRRIENGVASDGIRPTGHRSCRRGYGSAVL